MSPEKNKYYILDVFSEKKYSGNQLAVVIVKEKISSADMQNIAREFNFSETTFILPGNTEKNTFNVRIFTPGQEVPFAGHPTLGTAYIILNKIMKHPAEMVQLNLKAGKIPVTVPDKKKPGLLWMKQNNPIFGKIYNNKDMAEIINLKDENIDNKYPVQEISTGLPFIMIPLRKLKDIKNAGVNIPEYNSYFRKKTARPLFIFCPETYSKMNHINSRMFAHCFGIPEDPATGSAGGCLAAYLTRYRYFGKNEIDIRVEQGYEINRRSLLHLRAIDRGDEIDINVGGRVIKVAEGELT